MHYTDNPPEAPAVLVAPRRKCDCYLWRVLKCPHCGKKHTHGAGTSEEHAERLLGHRVGHCPPSRKKDYSEERSIGYILTRADNEIY